MPVNWTVNPHAREIGEILIADLEHASARDEHELAMFFAA